MTMPSEPDPTTSASLWLSKSDAAAQLGVSERTLDRLCRDDKGPELKYVRLPGRRPKPVYNPTDVERLAAANQRAMVIAPDSPLAPVSHSATKALARAVPLGPAAAQFRALLEGLFRVAREQAGPAEKLYLTIPEAAAYTGLSKTLLRRLVSQGRLPAVRDRALKVLRRDLAAHLNDALEPHGGRGAVEQRRKGAAR
jgi:excisionase family DNA binding protein